MNVSTLLHQAAELNEDGVYELADDNFGEAMGSFENALQTMMQVCQLTHDAKGSTSSSTTASNNSIRRSSSHKQLDTTTPMLPPPSPSSSVEVPYLRDDRFYLYSCTVTFSAPPSSSSNNPPSTQEIAFYCATILFNLALAHHQQGQKLQQGALKRDASLRQALCLYQEAARTLQCLDHMADDILLMTLAILNNQGQILYTLQEADREICFQQLLLQSTTALHATNNFSVFEQSQINEFIRNAVVASTTLAPTAACA